MALKPLEPELCIHCPDLCLYSCPAVHGSGNSATSPFGKVNAIHWSKKNSKWPLEEATSLSYLCTGCNLCTDVCEHDQPVADYLYTFRQECFSERIEPACSRKITPDEDSLSQVLHKVSRKFSGKRSSSVLFFPGCDMLAQGAERIEKTLQLLEMLGIKDVGIAPSSPTCCGKPWHDLGDTANYMSRTIKWQRHFSKANGVIIGDSRCMADEGSALWATPDKEETPRIFSLWEVLLRSIRSPLKQKLTMKVALHKSCHLNLQLQNAKLPRALFDSLFTEPPVLLSQEGRLELCCGFSGGMAQTNPDVAEGAAKTLLNQAKALECDVVLSFSPSCAEHLRKASEGKDLPEAMDLVDLLWTGFSQGKTA
jgi:Fe-S oxidoreductase